MKYNPDIHQRRSIRLRGFDYSQVGAYFVTLCVQNRECLFGKIEGGEMYLNDVGRVVETVWYQIPEFYHGVEIDAFQVMPNHIHGIIILVGATPCGCPELRNDKTTIKYEMHQDYFIDHKTGHEQKQKGQPQGVAPTMSLPDVVHRFKTMTTKRYVDGVHKSGWPPFHNKLWQRNYYEHIIRNETEWNQVREYICNNPMHWEIDQENRTTDSKHCPKEQMEPWQM